MFGILKRIRKNKAVDSDESLVATVNLLYREMSNCTNGLNERQIVALKSKADRKIVSCKSAIEIAKETLDRSHKEDDYKKENHTQYEIPKAAERVCARLMLLGMLSHFAKHRTAGRFLIYTGSIEAQRLSVETLLSEAKEAGFFHGGKGKVNCFDLSNWSAPFCRISGSSPVSWCPVDPIRFSVDAHDVGCLAVANTEATFDGLPISPIVKWDGVWINANYKFGESGARHPVSREDDARVLEAFTYYHFLAPHGQVVVSGVNREMRQHSRLFNLTIASERLSGVGLKYFEVD